MARVQTSRGDIERTQFPHELRDQLGVGPIGRVFAARAPTAQDALAIKVVHRGLYEDRAQLQALKRAYDGVTRLDTPFVSSPRHLLLGPDTPSVVMARDSGVSLASVWARSDRLRPCPPPIALEYVTQITRGLAALHAAGVVHGNLKPSNIRLSTTLALAQTMQFALADAIFANIVAARQLVRLHADVAVYAAPEQFDADVSPQADQYALAVFAWMWLTGRSLFAPRSVASIVEQKRAIAETLERFRGSLDVGAHAVFRRALDPEPDSRFPSVTDFRDALAEAIEGRLGAVNDEGAEEPPPTLSRRQVMIGGLAAAGTVALVGVTGRWLDRLAAALSTPTGTAEQPATTLPLAFQHASNLGAPTDQVNAVAWAPGGNRLVAGSDDRNLYLWDAPATNRVGSLLSGHQDIVTDVAWDPTGERIASCSYDATARIWDARLRQTLVILRGHVGTVYGVAWSLDGATLLTGGSDQSVRVWDASTGEQLRVFRPQGLRAAIRVMALSPDGEALAAGDLDGVITMCRASDGEPIGAPVETGQKVLALAYSPDSHVLASGAVDGTARLWNALTATPLLTLPAQPGFTRALSWSPDQTVVTAGYENGAVVIWRSRGPAAPRGMFHPTGAARALRWNSDATLLAVGTAHRTVELWRPLQNLNGGTP